MHVIQTITAIHDRYISTALTSPQTVDEIYHLSRAAALFAKKLSIPVKPCDRDGLWATAALLGIISMSWIEATDVEEAWPLSKPDPSDLDWIRMSGCKVAIWEITNPLRPDSVFHVMADDYRNGSLFTGDPKHNLEHFPPAFLNLFELDESSTSINNPYYTASMDLALILNMEDQPNTFRYLGMITHMDPDYKALLMRRDPRALLLMGYWYVVVIKIGWWLERRALLECQAICLYLDRYHPDETLIQELLTFPKMQCGLMS